jgi:soluble lytic murein transglycosylase-like protein
MLIALAVVALTAAATLAPPASAENPTTAHLARQRDHVRGLLAEARQKAHDAAADLAAARDLKVQTNGAALPAPLAAAPTGAAPSLSERLLADGIVGDDEIAALKARADARHRQVQRWAHKLHRLNVRLHRRHQIAQWADAHSWRPLTKLAGAKYGVDPGGLYRMMLLESGGDPRVVGGIYNGLFQYTHSEWARHWNPYRHESIYDGWAQIRATALALSKGMGPGQWPYTYPAAF